MTTGEDQLPPEIGFVVKAVWYEVAPDKVGKTTNNASLLRVIAGW
jgi:hypothetical protein